MPFLRWLESNWQAVFSGGSSSGGSAREHAIASRAGLSRHCGADDSKPATRASNLGQHSSCFQAAAVFRTDCCTAKPSRSARVRVDSHPLGRCSADAGRVAHHWRRRTSDASERRAGLRTPRCSLHDRAGKECRRQAHFILVRGIVGLLARDIDPSSGESRTDAVTMSLGQPRVLRLISLLLRSFCGLQRVTSRRNSRCSRPRSFRINRWRRNARRAVVKRIPKSRGVSRLLPTRHHDGVARLAGSGATVSALHIPSHPARNVQSRCTSRRFLVGFSLLLTAIVVGGQSQDSGDPPAEPVSLGVATRCTFRTCCSTR